MKNFILFWGLLVFWFVGSAQAIHTNDSTNLMEELDHLREYYKHNFDSTLFYANKLALKASILQNEEIKFQALLYKAKAYNKLGKKDSALFVLDNLLSQTENLSNRVYKIEVYTARAEVYTTNYNFDYASNNLANAEKLINESDSIDIIFSVLVTKGMLHKRMKNYDTSLKIYTSLLEKYQDQLNTTQKFNCNNSIGGILAMQRKYNEAERYFNNAYTSAIDEEHTKNKALITYNLGVLYVRQKKYDQARKFISLALQSYTKINNALQIEHCYRVLSAIELDFRNLDNAELYAKMALKKANEIKNPKARLGNYKNLYLIYKYRAEETDDKELLKKELDYFKKWAYLNDSLYEVDMAEKILTLEKEFETEKKNNEITLLQKDNELKDTTIQNQQAQRKYLLIIIGLALAAVGVFVYWYMYYKRVNRTLQKQSKQIVSQNEEIIQKNEKLEKAVNTRNKLFSIIAHDLRSPLSSMATFSKLIKFYLGDKKIDSVIKVADEMHEKNSYVLELTDNLLSWAQSQSDELEPQYEKVSLNEIISECIDIYQQPAEEKQIDLLCEEQHDILLWSDRNMVKTIIRNLINNAIKFTNPGGKVEITYEKKSVWGTCIIKDNGIGMSEEEARQLFSDKKYIKQGTKNEKSTGLGLSVCNEFIQKLGGSIKVKSFEGKGSAFYVCLPVYENQEKLNQASSSPEYDFSDSLN